MNKDDTAFIIENPMGRDFVELLMEVEDDFQIKLPPELIQAFFKEKHVLIEQKSWMFSKKFEDVRVREFAEFR